VQHNTANMYNPYTVHNIQNAHIYLHACFDTCIEWIYFILVLNSPNIISQHRHTGLSQAKDVTTVDLVWNNHIFSRWSEVFDKKWKLFIGHVLLKRQIHFRNFLAENRAAVRSAQQGNSKHSNAVVCYRKLIVGCGQLSG